MTTPSLDDQIHHTEERIQETHATLQKLHAQRDQLRQERDLVRQRAQLESSKRVVDGYEVYVHHGTVYIRIPNEHPWATHHPVVCPLVVSGEVSFEPRTNITTLPCWPARVFVEFGTVIDPWERCSPEAQAAAESQLIASLKAVGGP